MLQLLVALLGVILIGYLTYQILINLFKFLWKNRNLILFVTMYAFSGWFMVAKGNMWLWAIIGTFVIFVFIKIKDLTAVLVLTPIPVLISSYSLFCYFHNVLGFNPIGAILGGFIFAAWLMFVAWKGFDKWLETQDFSNYDSEDEEFPTILLFIQLWQIIFMSLGLGVIVSLIFPSLATMY
jgi:hypothetical protein